VCSTPPGVCRATGGGGSAGHHGGGGHPYENAKAESFFRTLKLEEVYLKDYRHFEEAHENIGEFIEEVYNEKRLHSSLGNLPPVEFEALHALKAGS
jgi:putative transposase